MIVHMTPVVTLHTENNKNKYITASLPQMQVGYEYKTVN